jgi:CO dehydrogenase/acetyl-CoA synthase beta subunit
MEVFDATIRSVRAFMNNLEGRKTWIADPSKIWPAGGSRNIVLNEDMGLELGSPEHESLSSLLWTNDISAISDNAISLVGPDFPESAGRSLSFAKVVLLGVTGFTEENIYDRYRDMELTRYDVDLKGFMLRAVSQYGREWCRISRDAIRAGFSSVTLGSHLIRLLKEKDYVKAVEIIFITSSVSAVRSLRDITAPAAKVIAAMNKMVNESDCDCEGCEYQDVCDDATELKRMHERLKDKTAGGRHG